MTVMITGGTGFLGANLAHLLVRDKGEARVVLTDLAPDYEAVKGIQDRVTVVLADVLELSELLDVMREHNVDRVAHFAYLQGPAVDANPARAIRVNCMGTTNVLEASRLQKVKRVVYASSIGVYPVRKNLTDKEVNEEMPIQPNSLYGACKMFNENVADFYWKKYGLDSIGLRPTAVFGIGRTQSRLRSHGEGWQLKVDLTAGGLVAAPGALAQGFPVVMPPDEQEVDWIYGADLAEAWYCALMVEKPAHRVFNVAAERIKVGDLTRYLRKAFPQGKITVSRDPGVAMPLTSTERLRKELGFRPRYTLEKMMAEYLAGLRAGTGRA